MEKVSFTQFSEQELRDIFRQEIERYFEDHPIPGQLPLEELLNVKQVAELLQTTPQNIHAKKREGKIPFIRFGGRVLFKRSEVLNSLPVIQIVR
ncbi:MAG: helix-turn-helix domain-containing protein [Bacteroidia bacterium]|nr:helix-turn-helix domain-containing protein [Bacteroidia bacterium]